VLTKPINVEQAKGTLRVARGLLRKNSDAAGAGSTMSPAMPAKTAPASAGGSFQPANRGAAAITSPSNRLEVGEFEAPRPAMIPEAMSAEFPGTTASARVADKPAVVPAPASQPRITIASASAVEERQPAGVIQNAIGNEAATMAAASVPPRNTTSAFTLVSGSAAAPAPAREVMAPPAKNRIVEAEPANPLHDTPHDAPHNTPHDAAHDTPHDTAPIPIPTFISGSSSDAPSFAALGEEDSGGSGGNKKILIAAAAVLALAALGYLGYGTLGKPSPATPASQPASAPQDSGQPARTPAPISSPVGAPSKAMPERAGSAPQTLAPKTSNAIASGNPNPNLSAGAANFAVIRIGGDVSANSEPEAKKPDSAPMRVKSNTAGTKAQAQDEESAPPLPSSLVAASANDSNLSGLMSSASSNPKPALAILKISQGVSQGLLIKRVTPKYPQPALAVHAGGAVQIEATINKEGNVTNPKVLSGAPVLAHAALEAVRQWRYKPYYLDGTPVEIQTQITVNFKAN
jgi:TonB family protein